MAPHNNIIIFNIRRLYSSLVFRHQQPPQRQRQRQRRPRLLLSLHSLLLLLLLLLSASFFLLFCFPPPPAPLNLNNSITTTTTGTGTGTSTGTSTANNARRMNIEEVNNSVFDVPMTYSKGSHRHLILWTTNHNHSTLFHGCSNASSNFLKTGLTTQPNRYLLIATSGGLNQQRAGIVDAVVAAYILNATLVVPLLDKNSFWKDSSNFSHIFDVDWFITYLSKEVTIVQHLPQNARRFTTTLAPRKCNRTCYETRILPLYLQKHVQTIHLVKFEYRLSNQLDDDLQKLRCRVNYHALRFTDPILNMGMKLVERMRMKSKRFVALHLRFEPDMLAFTGCYYGGGEKEIEELGKLRKRWKNLHEKNPDKERRNGKCPLSPEEAGVMLRALGYDKDVHIYIASGEVYGGESALAPLRGLFPNLHSKETLTSKEELEQFSNYSSRMAALDFIVCDESDVFVTNNNGNMAKILAGKRRYFGHKPTIRPNAKKLQRLFSDRRNMRWEEFSAQVEAAQIGFMGEANEVKPERGVFYEHPLSCICETSLGNKGRSRRWEHRMEEDGGLLEEEEQESSEGEYPKDENAATVTMSKSDTEQHEGGGRRVVDSN